MIISEIFSVIFIPKHFLWVLVKSNSSACAKICFGANTMKITFEILHLTMGLKDCARNGNDGCNIWGLHIFLQIEYVYL